MISYLVTKDKRLSRMHSRCFTFPQHYIWLIVVFNSVLHMFVCWLFVHNSILIFYLCKFPANFTVNLIFSSAGLSLHPPQKKTKKKNRCICFNVQFNPLPPFLPPPQPHRSLKNSDIILWKLSQAMVCYVINVYCMRVTKKRSLICWLFSLVHLLTILLHINFLSLFLCRHSILMTEKPRNPCLPQSVE